jgi:hypothetical protein
MPNTTISKKANKCKQPEREPEVEISYPIMTPRHFVAEKNKLPDEMIEAIRIAVNQKSRPNVSASWYHTQNMTYSTGPNWNR